MKFERDTIRDDDCGAIMNYDSLPAAFLLANRRQKVRVNLVEEKTEQVKRQEPNPSELL